MTFLMVPWVVLKQTTVVDSLITVECKIKTTHDEGTSGLNSEVVLFLGGVKVGLHCIR